MNDELKTFMATMNKQLAKDNKPLLFTAAELPPIQRMTTGLLSLDVATGGGWPMGKWIEVYGRQSNGKTSIILHTIGTNQRLNPDFTTFWLASEPYNEEWAEQFGIDNSRVITFHTNNMEVAYQMVIDAARSEQFDCLVIDSYPALAAGEEITKDMDQQSMALGARRTAQFFRKIEGFHNENRPWVGFFVNQLRDNIGVHSPYGTPKTTPGGNAKNYFFYQQVVVSRDEWIEEKVEGLGKVKVGQVNKYLMEKNKAGVPKTVAMGDFYFTESEKGFKGGQFDLVKDVITMAVLFKVIRRGGAWFYYKPAGMEDELKWNGLSAMTESIRGNMELYEEIAKVTLEIATTKE